MSQPASARILVVDDEQAILRAVRTNLAAHGFHVETAESLLRARELLSHRPDVIILDLGLPDGDGVELIQEVRRFSNVPIIILSVRSAEREKVAALDLGADDYLTKPFGIDELLARIRVALRHVAQPSAGAEAVFRTGGLEIDYERRRVAVEGREIRLTPTEYDLLKTLASHPNKTLTDRMLLQRVWGPAYGEEAHYLHVYVARLRKKIEPNTHAPQYLITDPGVGYRLLTQEP